MENIDLDEDIYYSYLIESGIDEMDSDRKVNDLTHGLTLGISSSIAGSSQR